MKLSSVTYYVARGVFYGYSQDSINAYLYRRSAVNRGIDKDLPTSTGTAFEDTGFIPAPADLVDPEKTIREINARRIFIYPFGEDSESRDPEDIHFGKFTINLMGPGTSRSLVERMTAVAILYLTSQGCPLEDD